MCREHTNHTGFVADTPWIYGRVFFSVTLVLMICAGAPTALAAEIPGTVYTYHLLNDVTATINTDGALIINSGPAAAPVLLADVAPVATNRRRWKRGTPPFITTVTEGAPGGQRGFSTHCDDDGDGTVDEDPLDGQDNDGDGRVDEDFAAISDAMVVVHQNGPRGNSRISHLEYYHWGYPHLRSTVFLSVQGRSGLDSGGTYRLTLGDHSWYETTLIRVRHNLAGKMEPGRVEGYVAQPSRARKNDGPLRCDSESGLWVGAIILSGTPGQPAVLDEGVLEIPLGDDPVDLAVCVAESWLQLNQMLNEATKVASGARDKITGRQAPWIAPPLCTQCRLSAAPDFSYHRTAAGELILTARITPERGVNIDPDLFRLDGHALGAPREIQWLPDEGPAARVEWTCMNTALLGKPHDRLSSPYGQLPDLLGHQASGYLRFVFAVQAEDIGHDYEGLLGSYTDGRPFDVAIVAIADEPTDMADTTDSTQMMKTENRRASLSPQLLEGFPNPFRDYIQLRFAVPATMGEAFIWGDAQDPPSDVNLEAAIPWKAGTPRVSVKIYSMNGQELMTLFAASQGPGQNMVQWDGTDEYGRQVASGTYFCKLQMDEWSVTKRLVYLR